MRRQGIQLLAAARQGDVIARCEVGRRYLLGSGGFPRHIETGIDYLRHPSVRTRPEAVRIIADCLPLESLLELKLEVALRTAALCGSASAQLKLAVWLVLRHNEYEGPVQLLRAATAARHGSAEHLLTQLLIAGRDGDLTGFLAAASADKRVNWREIALLGARDALGISDLQGTLRCLRFAMSLDEEIAADVAALVVAVVEAAERLGAATVNLPPRITQACLEMKVNRGEYCSVYTLARALCGISCGALAPGEIVAAPNLRRGAALLLRSAEGGRNEAWWQLYCVHAVKDSSVTNPELARFFLERSAAVGKSEAQRMLGACVLRESRSLVETEHGIELLFNASREGDVKAKNLLKTLVLPVTGLDADAQMAIDRIEQEVPFLAVRLRLSRAFGLTKLEALTVSPADGMRSWGLVVGRNPFVSQRRVSSPRAIPAISEEAMQALRAAAVFFAPDRHHAGVLEGDLRNRSRIQRRTFKRHPGLPESMFFRGCKFHYRGGSAAG